MSDVFVWPAYRRGFYITHDPKSRWLGTFDWKVTVGDQHGYSMGWFGSLQSAYNWVYKQ